MNLESITLIVTVIIFLLSTIINNFNIIDDRKKRWYVEIIINSNLNKIDTFFKEILDLFKKHKKGLNSKYSNVDKVYLEDKAKKTKELHDIQNKFSFEIIPIFKSYDKKNSILLLKILENFRDYYTENIGIETSKTNKDITTELEELKGDFYKKLYQPVKNSFFNDINLERVTLIIILIIFVILFVLK